MSNSVRPHRRQPTRLLRPWDSPGKNTGVGCHSLFQCMQVKSESEVPQSCSTLSDSMVYSLPGSSIHGVFQARVLEWVAIAFSISSLLESRRLKDFDFHGFPGGASGKELACQRRRHRRRRFNPWVRKIPRRRKWQQVSLPGESHGQRSLAGYSPRGHKELDMTEVPKCVLSCV